VVEPARTLVEVMATWVTLTTWELSDRGDLWVLLEREAMPIKRTSSYRLDLLYLVVDVLSLPKPRGSNHRAAHVFYIPMGPDEEPDEDMGYDEWEDAILHPSLEPVSLRPRPGLRLDLAAHTTEEEAQRRLREIGELPWVEPVLSLPVQD